VCFGEREKSREGTMLPSVPNPVVRPVLGGGHSFFSNVGGAAASPAPGPASRLMSLTSAAHNHYQPSPSPSLAPMAALQASEPPEDMKAEIARVKAENFRLSARLKGATDEGARCVCRRPCPLPPSSPLLPVKQPLDFFPHPSAPSSPHHIADAPSRPPILQALAPHFPLTLPQSSSGATRQRAHTTISTPRPRPRQPPSRLKPAPPPTNKSKARPAQSVALLPTRC